ncbi:MAG: hypothetical protein U0359_41185 [Byssovorax sp.]
MKLDEWAEKHLVVTLPRDFSVWHWTRSPETVRKLRALIDAGGDLSASSTSDMGAVGHGLYLTTSAIDLMERGEEVLAATVVQGTRALMVHPDLFGVGFPELFEIGLSRVGWSWELPSFARKINPAEARPAPQVLDGLLARLDLPCCVYIYGMHLAFMVRDARCLRLVPEMDQARTVADYVKANPKDRSMLVPHEVVTRWIARRAS